MSRHDKQPKKNENDLYLEGLQAAVEAAENAAPGRWTHQEAAAGHTGVETQGNLAAHEAATMLGRSALKNGGGAKEPEQPEILSVWQSFLRR